jgi:hypothetical protein
MDQNKNQGGQKEGQPRQGSQQQGSQPGQPNWNKGQTGQNQPKNPPERGTGTQTERNRESESERGAGISNRSMDEEISEQEELPDRGSSQSDR